MGLCGVDWGRGFSSPTGRPRLPWLNVDRDAARSPFYDGYCVISVPPQPLVVTSRLTNVLVRKLMSQTHPLRLVLDGLPIYDGMLELLDDGLVDCITLYEKSTMFAPDSTETLTKSSTVHAFFLNTTGVL